MTNKPFTLRNKPAIEAPASQTPSLCPYAFSFYEVRISRPSWQVDERRRVRGAVSAGHVSAWAHLHADVVRDRHRPEGDPRRASVGAALPVPGTRHDEPCGGRRRQGELLPNQASRLGLLSWRELLQK